MHDCLFCRIAAGELPAKLIHEDDALVAFFLTALALRMDEVRQLVVAVTVRRSSR